VALAEIDKEANHDEWEEQNKKVKTAKKYLDKCKKKKAALVFDRPGELHKVKAV